MSAPAQDEKRVSDSSPSTPGDNHPAKSDAEAQQSAQPPLDGGARAYLTLLGGYLTLFTTVGYATAFGVYQDYFSRTGLASPSNISWIGSVQLFLLLGLGLPAGRLLDKGYWRPTMLVGSIIYVFSFFMMSLAHPDKYYQVFLAQGVGCGLGSGLIYVPAAAIQGQHWKRHRTLVLGITLSGGSLGGIVYPIMLNHLIFGRVGFAWGVRAAAFMTLALLLVANLTMSTRLPPPKAGAPTASARAFLTDKAFLPAVVGLFLVAWGIFFPYFYLQNFAVDHGVNQTLSFYTIAMVNGASIIGRTIPNFYADRTGPFNMLAPACFISGALVLAMFGLRSSGGATVAFAIIYGIFSGSYFSLMAPSLVSLVKDPSQIGLAIGAGFTVSSFASLTGTPINGALLKDGLPWHKPIIFSAVTMIAGTASLLVARQIIVKRKGGWKA